MCLSNGTKMPLVPINSSLFQGNTWNGGSLTLAQPKSESEKENDASMLSAGSEVLKHLIFQNVDGCTFNFNFGSK